MAAFLSSGHNQMQHIAVVGRKEMICRDSFHLVGTKAHSLQRFELEARYTSAQQTCTVLTMDEIQKYVLQVGHSRSWRPMDNMTVVTCY
jgi:hypothetical protein